MVRHLLPVLAVLAFACTGAWAADTPGAAPAPATPPAAAAPAPAAAPAAAAATATPAAAPAAAAPAAPATPPLTLDALNTRLTTVEGTAKTLTGQSDPAGNNSGFNSGDNCWVLVSSALVLLMTLPGLALFYGGMVRRKNVLGTLMQSMAIACIVSILWAVVGYSWAFGPGPSHAVLDDKGQPTKDASGNPVTAPDKLAAIWGGNSYMFLDGVCTDKTHQAPSAAKNKDGNWAITQATMPAGQTNNTFIPGPNSSYSASISHGSYCLFQLMFAIITPALICGAYAERMKFSTMCIFSSVWLLFVYCPLAHMVWGANGWLNWSSSIALIPAFDFAGGTVVHISSGVAALMCALFLGKRKGYPETPMPPHSLVLSFIGAALLWVGWFGFNAGSAVQANGLAMVAFANTHFATAAAAIGWPLAEWIIKGKPTVLGACSGAVAGLVAVTPASGFVNPMGAIALGFIAGVLCFTTASYMKRMLGYDDSLDAFGVHAIGGMWGAWATGIFFRVEVNPNVGALNADGTAVNAVYGRILAHDYSPWIGQLGAIAIAFGYTAVATCIILAILKYTIGLRVTPEQETEGLDLSQHGEEGYTEAA